MMCSMLSPRAEDLQVTRPIVCSYPILVVDYFTWIEFAFDFLLSSPSMDKQSRIFESQIPVLITVCFTAHTSLVLISPNSCFREQCQKALHHWQNWAKREDKIL